MDRYTVISSDCHNGPPLEMYRDYLDPQYRDKLDESIAAINEATEKGQVTGLGGSKVESYGKARRELYDKAAGVKEGGATGAWDPKIRSRELDRDAVAGEVLFPQGTAFGGAVADSKLDALTRLPRHSYELRFAGCVAYNRWLTEFCSYEPERHAGAIVVAVD